MKFGITRDLTDSSIHLHVVCKFSMLLTKPEQLRVHFAASFKNASTLSCFQPSEDTGTSCNFLCFPTLAASSRYTEENDHGVDFSVLHSD